MTSPDPTSMAHALVADVAGRVLVAATGIAPLAVPVVLALGALAWVLRKFGVARSADVITGVSGGSGSFVHWDDEDAQRHRMAVQHAERDELEDHAETHVRSHGQRFGRSRYVADGDF